MPLSFIDLPWLPDPPDDFGARCKAARELPSGLGARLQHLASHRLNEQQSRALARGLTHAIAEQADLAPLAAFRLGILSNATYDLLLDNLPAAGLRHGVALEIVAAPYDQVSQEALDPTAGLHAARLDAVLVAIDHHWLDLDRPALGGATERLEAAMERLSAVVDGLGRNSGATPILQTLAMPATTLFGGLDRRTPGTVRALIAEANRRIADLAQERGCYLLDLAALADRIGADRWFDEGQWAAYRLPFSADAGLAWAETLGRLLGAVRGKARKCLVLDLDNTLWGGVVGDDGVAGLLIGHGDARGEAFLALQSAALSLRERGVILAVCSKNDDAIARSPFRDHPEMLLREAHLAVFRANWVDKATNLEIIAETLNLGLEALVFFDDNPAERAQVRAALPMVAVPELPDDPAEFTWILNATGYFEAVVYSEEDGARAAAYGADEARAAERVGTRDLGEYLASLGMELSAAPFDSRSRQRVVQLINKTNQFNLTTRRYTEREVAELEGEASVFALQVRVKDRFGDLGMVSVVICRPQASAAVAGTSDCWEIDTWLMSCRVLGRRIEDAVLNQIVEAARARGVRRLFGHYSPTAKNGLVSAHYQNLGFAPMPGATPPETLWTLDIEDYVPKDAPIEISD